MGLTKQYLRVVPAGILGIVTSSRGNIVHLNYKREVGRYVAVPACQHVFIWDLRRQEKVLVLEGDKAEVVVISASPDNQHIAVGYSNGTINIFNIYSAQLKVAFNGHKTAVTALRFDEKGLRLASGGKDTRIILWDIVAEAGMYKLSGHKDMITCVHLLSRRNILISSSKDSYIKLWDLETQHCFKTLTSHRAEVWSFAITHDERRLITGCTDHQLRVWKINYLKEDTDSTNEWETISSTVKKLKDAEGENFDEVVEITDDDDDEHPIQLSKYGSINKSNKGRVVSMSTDAKDKFLICHGVDNVVDIFKLCNEDETKKSIQKRERKRKKKTKITEEEADKEEEVTENLLEPQVKDEYKLMQAINVGKKQKIKSSDVLYDERKKETKIALTLGNNSIECYSCATNEDSKFIKSNFISSQGHRSDVRTVSFSHDSTAVVSASLESCKVWNIHTAHCLVTVPCQPALCSQFAPGDGQVIIGCRTGVLQVLELATASVIHTFEAHSASIWSLTLYPDMLGVVTASADKSCKFWDFELSEDKKLSLDHTRTLELEEEALCVRMSGNKKLLAVSLLDSTVRVFYADTLKFFLSLYGHKLPVLCMDISSDSTLIITGSADRNIKIWGLDFGDCHKSLFAHDDSIMCLQFIPKTHMFFSAGKDKLLKQWDADKFEKILTLEGHLSDIWNLAISANGKYVVTSSHDKSLRFWQKTNEPLVLEEEKEMEREAELDKQETLDDTTVIPGEKNTEIDMANKKTVETINAADRLMEALEFYRTETKKLSEIRLQQKEISTNDVHPLMKAFGVERPEEYVLEVIKRIKSSEIEKCVLLLQFSYIPLLLPLLSFFIKNGWELEVSTRLMFFLLRVHHQQIISTQKFLPIMDDLVEHVDGKLRSYKDMIGFNLAGLKLIQREIDEQEDVKLFTDATRKFKEKKRKLKQKAILTVRPI